MRWVKWIKNPYIMVALAFLVWIFFFDKNNIIDQLKSRRDYQKIKDDVVYYEKEIEKIKKENAALFTDEKTLEKFARERYLMKHDTEELFLILDTSRHLP